MTTGQLYQAKPIECRAVKWLGDNLEEIRAFRDEWTRAVQPPDMDPALPWASVHGGLLRFYCAKSDSWPSIHPGSYVILEADRSGLYPCAEADFERRWTPIERSAFAYVWEAPPAKLVDPQSAVEEIEITLGPGGP